MNSVCLTEAYDVYMIARHMINDRHRLLVAYASIVLHSLLTACNACSEKQARCGETIGEVRTTLLQHRHA